MTVIACFCTCPAETADRIATTLVEERLAACVNLLPGAASIYRWEGRVERAQETLLVIKTARDRLEALTARVTALHPHELPEVIAIESAGGLPAYLEWIMQETRTGAGA